MFGACDTQNSVRLVLTREISDLESQLRTAETAVANGSMTVAELQSLKASYREVDTRRRRHDYRYYMMRKYAEGDRAGRLLAG
ncbi:hypothetical protein NDU88_008055 [Pleurodeles waltl]|uniref:Uncharacterized protein n=1 Tax=Pleurodeles waltl TaxID=8319 RepID=A0AAV7PPB0_PLEWA|nr:hypothetical protein NDU88_008055 [Pleurodeles waltl]